MNKEKIKKILKIILIVFVILSAIGFWFLVGAYFWFGDQDASSSEVGETETQSSTKNQCDRDGNLGIIKIHGRIVLYLGAESDNEISSDDVISCVNDLQGDNNVKGIIVEIDSTGGSPVASEEIMNAFMGVNKPIVSVVRESAVSGAYLIATATDKIFASEISDIGGIGITMSYLDYSAQNQDKGIVYQQLSSGKFKDAGDSDRPLTYEEKQLFMRDIKIMHEAFVKNVAVNRNLEIEKVAKLADGSSMLGIAAKENKLIDEIGGINSAKIWLNNKFLGLQ